VFVNFKGALWEHTVTDKNSGWSTLWDSGVTQMSAAAGQADTVFAMIGDALWEHSGTDQNSGWSKLWDSGVTGISAGVA
jgi:hypothetical protein